MELVDLIKWLDKKGIIRASYDGVKVQRIFDGNYDRLFYDITPKGKTICTDFSLSFEDVCIVPNHNDVASRNEVNLSTILTPKIALKSPLIAANMRCVTSADFIIKLWSLGAFGILHRFYDTDKEMCAEIRKLRKAGVPAVASCGIRPEMLPTIKKMINAGAEAIVLDVAHADGKAMIDMAKAIKGKHKDIELIIGNICNDSAVDKLAPYASALKTGIGNGSICQTQHRTGAGGGQISSVMECAAKAKEYGIPIISDGGINEAGDVAKALIAGATSCMGGKIFARCPESAAEVITDDEGRRFKSYYGMASNKLKEQIGVNGDKPGSEGVAFLIPEGISCDKFVPEFLKLLRSSYTYSGAIDLETLWKYGELRKITPAAYQKGKPHVANHKGAIKISN